MLDPFGGAGSTLIACENTERKCRMIELEPKYVDITIRRWQAHSGSKAILERNGKTFDSLLA